MLQSPLAVLPDCWAPWCPPCRMMAPAIDELAREMAGTVKVGKAAEMAAYVTPEVRMLFEEWARSVEDEMLAVLKARGPLDLAGLAGALKISPESALHFLGRLVREGKATISGIQATGIA